jgi:hypothetical protein
MPTDTTRSASATHRFPDLRLGLGVFSGRVIMLVVALVLTSVAASEAGAGAGAGSNAPGISGSVGGYDWRVEVFKRTKSPERPCLRVNLVAPSSEVGRSTVCGVFDPLPLLTASTGNAGTAKRSAIGMVFGPKVVRARVWLRGRSPRNVQLRLLGSRQARALGLAPLRYGGTAYAGPSCLKRVVGYDRSGRVVKPVIRIPCG